MNALFEQPWQRQPEFGERGMKKAPGGPQERDPGFHKDRMHLYEGIALNDPMMADLITRWNELDDHQASGNGTHEDAKMKEGLEKDIAELYLEIQKRAGKA